MFKTEGLVSVCLCVVSRCTVTQGGANRGAREGSEVAVSAVGDGHHRAVSFRSLRFGIRDLEGRPKPWPFWPPLMLICSG